LAETYKKRIIFGVHPRTKKRIDDLKIKFPTQVELMKPLGFLDYIKLQTNAMCVLTDSGTVSEESSILNFPAVNLRQTHERNEAMDQGSVILTGLNPERVMQAIAVAIRQKRGTQREFYIPDGYGEDNVSKKVVRIILSYTDYINRITWFKES
jgi:UDP-N-acetylglucosamine 2-epimerase (non-hydrolysing)